MGLFDFIKPKGEEPKPAQPVQRKILIIDDDQLIRTYYYNLLTKNNYLVIMATNGKEGLASVAQNIPDLVLLDIVMPEMDGKTVLKELKENPQTAKIPVIMLSSAASIENMEETQFHKAYTFLNKNVVGAEQVLTTVRAALPA